MKISKKGAALPPSLEEYVINMSQADADELRVLVYVLSKDGDTSTEEIGEALGLSETDVIAAVSYWRGVGLIASAGRTRKAVPAEKNEDKKKGAGKPTELPTSVRDTDTRTYTGEEIARIIKEKPEMESLLDFAQARLEKVFSPSDIAKLVYLEDYVLLSAPMIMRIIDYCVEIDKKSMRYVEKTALSIYDEGVCDYETLEEYFEKKRAARSAEGIVRRIMGIGARSFTAKEKEHISKWFGEYGSAQELIELAYEKTIANISKPSVPYMSKLLSSWHEKGYKTCGEVEAGRANTTDEKGGKLNLDIFDEASKSPLGDADTAKKPGLDLDDFFENP